MKIYKAPLINGIRRISSGKDQRRGSILSDIKPVVEKEKPNKDILDEGVKPTYLVGGDKLADKIDDLIKEPSVQSDFSTIGHKNYLDSKIDIEALNKEISDLKNKNEFLQDKINTLDEKSSDQQNEIKEKAKNEGYQSGINKANEETRIAIDQFLKIISQLEEKLTNCVIETDPIVVEAVFTALCKILGDRYQADNLVIQVVETSLKEVRESVNIRLLLTEKDYAFLDKKLEIQSKLSGKHVSLAVDPRVNLGGCIIETDVGVWDARLETQLQRLKDTMIEAVKAREDLQ